MPADTATLNHVIGMSTHPAEGKEKYILAFKTSAWQ